MIDAQTAAISEKLYAALSELTAVWGKVDALKGDSRPTHIRPGRYCGSRCAAIDHEPYRPDQQGFGDETTRDRGSSAKVVAGHQRGRRSRQRNGRRHQGSHPKLWSRDSPDNRCRHYQNQHLTSSWPRRGFRDLSSLYTNATSGYRKPSTLKVTSRKFQCHPICPPVLRKLKKDILSQRRELDENIEKKSRIHYLKLRPFVMLKIKDHPDRSPRISQDEIVKDVLGILLQLQDI